VQNDVAWLVDSHHQRSLLSAPAHPFYILDAKYVVGANE
jgi:hypothetical protein